MRATATAKVAIAIGGVKVELKVGEEGFPVRVTFRFFTARGHEGYRTSRTISPVRSVPRPRITVVSSDSGNTEIRKCRFDLSIDADSWTHISVYPHFAEVLAYLVLITGTLRKPRHFPK